MPTVSKSLEKQRIYLTLHGHFSGNSLEGLICNTNAINAKGKKITQHFALKIASLLFNGDFKLFSDCALSLITWFMWFIWFWKCPVEVGEQLCDAMCFTWHHQMTTPAPYHAPDHLYPLHQKSKVVVRTHFLHRCYERSWDTLCPALMFLCFYIFVEKKKIFFLSSFQLQDSQVTELKPNKQHRITGDKDERETEWSASKRAHVCVYISLY